MNSVDSNGSVVTVMNRITNSIWLHYISNHMKMNWISSYFKCLANISQFDVRNFSDNWIISHWVHENYCSILISWWSFWISSENNISWKQAHFCSNIKINASIIFSFGKMCKKQLGIKSNYRIIYVSSINRDNIKCLSMVHVIISWSYYNLFSYLPINCFI